MSTECNSSCNSCNKECGDRKKAQIKKEALHPMSQIKKVIGVLSGKGGVGKSMVTAMLASEMKRKGYRVGILDADITGPSIPKVLGIDTRAQSRDNAILPVKSKGGIDVMSINLLLEKETDAVIWRGPVIAGVVKQFWNQVIWDDLDYLFVDMPPGTGDVALTVFQSIPVDGVILVTTPQDLVGMIVEKAVDMTSKMQVPVLGLIENMSYFQCDACQSVHHIFGVSHLEEKVKEKNLSVLAQIPIHPEIAQAADAGNLESLQQPWLEKCGQYIADLYTL